MTILTNSSGSSPTPKPDEGSAGTLPTGAATNSPPSQEAAGAAGGAVETGHGAFVAPPAAILRRSA